MNAMVPAEVPNVGLPAVTLERLAAAQEIVRTGKAGDVIDVLVYTDALVAIAREKRAAEVSREAARTRIDAIRRLGELVKAATDPEALHEIIPTRFWRCEDIAAIPQRLFKKAVGQLLEAESACTIPSVIRRACVLSLERVESNIFVAWDGSYWIADGGKRRIHIHSGGLEGARRRLGLKRHPGALDIDHAYSTARIHASSLSQLGAKLSGEARRLVGEAELAQMRVAELLDGALRVVGDA